jgi:hypothetical protein
MFPAKVTSRRHAIKTRLKDINSYFNRQKGRSYTKRKEETNYTEKRESHLQGTKREKKILKKRR